MTGAAAVRPGFTATDWEVWTTTARLVVTDPDASAEARALVERRLDEVDRAASRFRADSEIRRIAESGDGRPVEVSPLLADLVGVALTAAARTDGDVDPTIGSDLVRLGYDRDLVDAREVRGRAAGGSIVARRRPTFRDVVLDGTTLRVPPGVLLDLGATAKARAADLCAVAAARRFGCGVLVSLGGDLRVAGPAPDGGWGILVQDGPGEPMSRIQLRGAEAVATSSTLHRVWLHGGARMHHVLDPTLGRPTPVVWRTATVAAGTCVEANTLTTAALVRGQGAPVLLERAGVAARLVASDGAVMRFGGWPA